MNCIKIDNLNFSYQNNIVFKGLNFELPLNKNLSIVGACGSGKTTLLKILNGDIEDYKGNIYINDLLLSIKKDELIDKKIKVVFSSIPDDILDVKKYLFENLKEDEINEVSKDLNIYFNLESLLKKEYIDYSLEDKYLMLIIKALLSNPSIIALDNILIYLNMRKKILLLNYLNSKGIMLINVTSNMEDVIYTDYMLVLYNGMSAIDGPVISVLENEKVIKRLGFSLPFMVDLSIQ